MAKKRVLAEARVNKKDEFYTKLETIEEELSHYEEHFKGKVVYCNCDDSTKSNFVNYFLDNFEKLELKKLIVSCYKERDFNLFNIHENHKKAHFFEFSKNKISKSSLKGDGDFRSDESIELLKQADIVVTNPPFSLFKEFVAQMIEYEKKFLIIGTTNAVTYKDFFKLIKENKVWPGVSFNKTVEFMLPEEYTEWDRIENGVKYAKVPAISWWTNLTHSKKESLILSKKYKQEDYPVYLNFEGIDVSQISEIPKDYKGIMGVPITFIGKYNSKEFEIIGLGAGEIYKGIGGKVIGKEFLENYFKNGGKGNYVANQYVLCYYDKDNKPVIPYMRILIKNKGK